MNLTGSPVSAVPDFLAAARSARTLGAMALACVMLTHPAWAQTGADCPPAAQLKAAQLFGLWSVRFTAPPAGYPDRATMLLERHAEFSDSLAGMVGRDLDQLPRPSAGLKPKAQLAGDLDEGMLLLDESSDGVSITGTWNGEMVPGSCGKSFRGQWKDTSSAASPNVPDVPFVITRLP